MIALKHAQTSVRPHRRSKAPFHRMIVMNRLNTENVFEALDGLSAVELAERQQLLYWQNSKGDVLGNTQLPGRA